MKFFKWPNKDKELIDNKRLKLGFSTKKDEDIWHYKNHGWYRVDSILEGCAAQSVMYWNGEKWLGDMNYAWNNPWRFNEKVVICKMIEEV